MTKIRTNFLAATLLLAFGSIQVVAAATITNTLGNDTPGFADGSLPAVFPDIINAQSGQSAPFDQPCGGDLSENCNTGWTHSYGFIVDPILSASLTIGIVDHDSAAEGSQLAQFSVDGFDLTASLDSQFEQPGDGLDGMYNEYTLDLGPGLFVDLADGSLMVLLALGGPGQTTCTLSFACPDEPVVPAVLQTLFNGANLIFSTLTIETLEISPPAIPIPAAAPLFATALALFGLYRRRVQQRRDV